MHLKSITILLVISLSSDKLNAQNGDTVDSEEVEQVQMQTTDDYDYEEPVQQHEQQLEVFAKLRESPESEPNFGQNRAVNASNATMAYKIDIKEITGEGQVWLRCVGSIHTDNFVILYKRKF